MFAQGVAVLQAEGPWLEELAKILAQYDKPLILIGLPRRTDGSELLIPAHEEFITAIDHEASVLTVDLPEGLLELS